jgi:hypothetical protein
MTIKQQGVILTHLHHHVDMVLIRIHLINLMIIYLKIKQEHIIKLIHKDHLKKEKEKIL